MGRPDQLDKIIAEKEAELAVLRGKRYTLEWKTLVAKLKVKPGITVVAYARDKYLVGTVEDFESKMASNSRSPKLVVRRITAAGIPSKSLEFLRPLDMIRIVGEYNGEK